MGTFDKNLRQQAVPYSGQICSYNHSQNSDQDISQSLTNLNTGILNNLAVYNGLGDLYNLAGNLSQTNYMVRVCRPKFGQIIQAYLNIALTFAATELNPFFNVSVGYGFASDNITALVPSSAYIGNCMNILNPPNALPFTGIAGQPSAFYGINIQPLVAQVGSANYSPDFYSVGIHFTTPPVMTGTYHLTKFFITGSVMVT